MTSRIVTIAMELADRAGKMQGKMRRDRAYAQSDIACFAKAARRRIDSISNSLDSATCKLAAAGASVFLAPEIRQSARLDKPLARIGLTAGGTVTQVVALRREFSRLAARSGQGIEDIQAGFNNLIQSGLGWSESLETIRAISSVMTVAGVNVLSGGAEVARSFQFDLTQPGEALELQGGIAVAGRLEAAKQEKFAEYTDRRIITGFHALAWDDALNLPKALADAVAQAGRLKSALCLAAEGFAPPVNKDIAGLINRTTLMQDDGPGLTCNAVELAGTYAARLGGKATDGLAGLLLQRGGPAASEAAEGKTDEAATGVTPVLVANWPASLLSGARAADYGFGAWIGDENTEADGGKTLGERVNDWLHTEELTTRAATVMRESDGDKKIDVYNDIPIVIHQYPDRVYAETSSMNTSVSIDLPRGGF